MVAHHCAPLVSQPSRAACSSSLNGGAMPTMLLMANCLAPPGTPEFMRLTSRKNLSRLNADQAQPVGGFVSQEADP
jgi:hypothetical protein